MQSGGRLLRGRRRLRGWGRGSARVVGLGVNLRTFAALATRAGGFERSTIDLGDVGASGVAAEGTGFDLEPLCFGLRNWQGVSRVASRRSAASRGERGTAPRRTSGRRRLSSRRLGGLDAFAPSASLRKEGHELAIFSGPRSPFFLTRRRRRLVRASHQLVNGPVARAKQHAICVVLQHCLRQNWR